MDAIDMEVLLLTVISKKNGFRNVINLWLFTLTAKF